MIKMKFANLSFFAVVVICMILYSCKSSDQNKNDQNKQDVSHKPTIQTYIDSCSNLYLQAIIDLKKGISKDSVFSKYKEPINLLHSKISQTFDSVTLVYSNHKLSQKDYDDFKQSLFFDSVASRSQELSQLGVNIELK